MRRVCFIIGLSLSLLVGCGHQKPKVKVTIEPPPAVHVGDLHRDLTSDSKNILEDSTSVLTMVTTRPVAPDIRDLLVSINVMAEDLVDKVALLAQVLKQEEKTAQDLSDAKDQIQNMTWEKNRPLYTKVDNLIYLCIIIFTLGLIAGAIGKRLGIDYLAIGPDISVIMLPVAGFCLAIRAVGPYVWIAGVSTVVAVVAAMIWFLWKLKDSLLVGKTVKGLMREVPDHILVQALPNLSSSSQDVAKKAYSDVVTQDPSLGVTPELMPKE